MEAKEDEKLEKKEELISIAEYAKIHGVTTNAIQRKALRKSFVSARKIGRNWVIDKNEPYTDHRIKSGNYQDWRKKVE